jgi:hypothetical protein
MESDKVNKYKTICKTFFGSQGLTVHFDAAVSEEIKWRPHIFATNNHQLILDVLTQENLADYYVKKYVEIRNVLPEMNIYVGLVGDLDYFSTVISECNRNGFGIYKINSNLKLLLEARTPTVDRLAERGELAIVFGRPFRNILALKKCLRKCKVCLYWFERNLPKKVFEVVYEAIEDGDIDGVDTIRFLRGIDDKLDDAFRKTFQSFREDVGSSGIEAQLRIICDSSIANRIHGRYIFSMDEQNEPLKIKLPPVNSLKANQWDTILTDVTEVPSFEEFWDNGVDIINSWNEIKHNVEEYCERKAQFLEQEAESLRSRSPENSDDEEIEDAEST